MDKLGDLEVKLIYDRMFGRVKTMILYDINNSQYIWTTIDNYKAQRRSLYVITEEEWELINDEVRYMKTGEEGKVNVIEVKDDPSTLMFHPFRPKEEAKIGEVEESFDYERDGLLSDLIEQSQEE